MKKQSGFTLIELMVVMAIIAILTTAGLSAYSGYIKKARDTERIENLTTINGIILSMISTSGTTPNTVASIRDVIFAMNNNQPLKDPLDVGGVSKSVCLDSNSGSTTSGACEYTYTQCDGGTGYALSARFESKTNQPMYSNDPLGDVLTQTGGNGRSFIDALYSIGSCRVYCADATACGATSEFIHKKIPTI